MRRSIRDSGAIAAPHAHSLRETLRSATSNVLHQRKPPPPALAALPVADQSTWCNCMLCNRRFESPWIGRRVCPTCRAERR